MLQKRRQNVELQEAQIMAQATALAASMKLKDFQGSHGWFTKFLSRHGYKSFKLHGEGNAADQEAVAKARDLVPKLIQEEVGFSLLP